MCFNVFSWVECVVLHFPSPSEFNIDNSLNIPVMINVDEMWLKWAQSALERNEPRDNATEPKLLGHIPVIMVYAFRKICHQLNLVDLHNQLPILRRSSQLSWKQWNYRSSRASFAANTPCPASQRGESKSKQCTTANSESPQRETRDPRCAARTWECERILQPAACRAGFIVSAHRGRRRTADTR